MSSCCGEPDSGAIDEKAIPCPVCGKPGKAVERVTVRHLNSSRSQEVHNRLEIDFMYLDLNVCGRCQGTDSGLDEAVAEARPVLASMGIELKVNKIHVQSEEQARALCFIISPTIRINGVDIALEIHESLCEDCGDLCGDSCFCREWVFKGKTYTVPPKAMILDAIFKAIYQKRPDSKQTYEDVPENLKRFFKNIQKQTVN